MQMTLHHEARLGDDQLVSPRAQPPGNGIIARPFCSEVRQERGRASFSPVK
jgi:hypothetical protein